ncbi:MAG TPA: type II CAAX endopeptidase family protein, partial [Pyrinomonadaceae bacterium]|nr:type II CAAX endopeptidase family protein [Pyrinomonadaceae bacterium]
WRLMIFLLILIVLDIVWEQSVRTLYGFVSTYRSIPYADFLLGLAFRGGLLVTALGLGYACAHILEELPWRSLGASFHKGWLKDLVIGSALGFLTLAVGVVVAMVGRGVSFSINPVNWSAVIKSMIGSVVLLVVAAFAEEAMFRGYALQTLTRAKIAWLGVALTLALFGVAHLTNPNTVPGFTFINTSIAGLWFAIAYLRTRSLWLPLGLHWAWNWALGWFFGLPVSGLKVASHPLMTASDTGPFWLTGGTYGIEGGLAGTIALALGTIVIWLIPMISADPELKTLTSQENPVTHPSVLSIRPADDHA